MKKNSNIAMLFNDLIVFKSLIFPVLSTSPQTMSIIFISFATHIIIKKSSVIVSI
jgi:hypothetical protein